MVTGIIGAMEEEIAKLKEDMTEIEEKNKAGMSFFRGKLHGKDVVVVRSGIGKVNAAICTQILACDYKIDRVINTGVAGGLYSELNVGDIVISSDAIYHDFDVTGFGYEEGLVEKFNGYCAEMEGCGIAHAAYLNNIPFVIIRAISDKADGSAKVDYSEFEMKAIEHTIKLMTELIKEF